MLVKTRGNICFNAETWMLFARPYQNFWLRACPHPDSLLFLNFFQSVGLPSGLSSAKFPLWLLQIRAICLGLTGVS